MTDGGKYGAILTSSGFDVHCLSMKPGRVSVRGILKLVKLLKFHRPSVVQTWMYHADLLGGIVSRASGVKSVVWNVRNSDPDCLSNGRFKKYIPRLCALLSGIVPSAIVFCAQQAKLTHEKIGYRSTSACVISNGYDFGKFYPSEEKLDLLSAASPAPLREPVLGMVARYNVQKDHANLFAALHTLKAAGYSFSFLLVGPGIDESNQDLRKLIDRYSLDDVVYLLGAQQNIPLVMNSLQIHILSSRVEGFPNVVAEAMACSVPCVSTDVGDAGLIIGDTGWVVPPCDSGALAKAIEIALEEYTYMPESWLERRGRCVERVSDRYSIQYMASRYEDIWHGLSV
ncbi:glycosyl transferase [Alcanivorax sp. N3-2A]|nr:glycosyl transferase [Alcanivorax sp. N3-2A]